MKMSRKTIVILGNSGFSGGKWRKGNPLIDCEYLFVVQ